MKAVDAFVSSRFILTQPEHSVNGVALTCPNRRFIARGMKP